MSYKKHFDTNAFPFKIPFILMTVEGDLLGDAVGMPRFIEFDRASGGMIYIRSSQGPEKYLTSNKCGTCFFGTRTQALKFEAKICLHNEAIVFEEYPTTKALGIVTEDGNKYCKCRGSYGSDSQGWFIMDPLYLTADRLPPVSELQHLVAVSDTDAASRRLLIMHFCESGKSSEEIANILMLLYGSKTPRVNLDLAEDEATLAKRRQQILKLVESGMSVKEVGEVLTLLYGTATQTEQEDEGSATLKEDEGEVESEVQRVSCLKCCALQFPRKG